MSHGNRMNPGEAVSITNPKVASPEPRWADFRGFSLLFDNPGNGLSPFGDGLGKMVAPIETAPRLVFYKMLANAVSEIFGKAERQRYGFCPLPASTFHVTVWDGLNAGNLHKVKTNEKERVKRFLSDLPHSLRTESPVTRWAEQSPLVSRSDWSITFRYKSLFNWDNQALVVQLLPVDNRSEERLSTLIEHRTVLSRHYQQHFGVPEPNPYTPHVTLGYFVNQSLANLTLPLMEKWRTILSELIGDLTITFPTINLYGFTDMVSFYRKYTEGYRA